LEEISSLDLHTGQARVRGHAILFSSGIAAPLPADFSEELSLAVFDVCGAPAWVKKKILPTDRVLILGMGKAGLLSALAALEVIPRDSLWVCDVRGEATRAALRCGLGAHTVLADASSPVSFQESLHRSGSGLFDLVVNTCNVPGTEAASILAAKQGGRILFFNMATDFSRAVLSAEGIGREVEMVMGNGFASGHWQYALDLVRRNRDVWKFF
jgi:L-erythro-3,5-diaminohexanoate dehydrogenase